MFIDFYHSLACKSRLVGQKSMNRERCPVSWVERLSPEVACPDRGICWYEPAGCRMGYVRFFSIKKSREGEFVKPNVGAPLPSPRLCRGSFRSCPLLPAKIKGFRYVSARVLYQQSI